MKEYGKYVGKRQEQLDSILPQDPLDESEKPFSEQLKKRVSKIDAFSGTKC